MKSEPSSVRSLLLSVFSIILLVALWEVYYAAGLKNSNFFPAPSALVATIIDSEFRLGIGSQSNTLLYSIISSLFRVYVGLVVGFFSALIVGALITSNKMIEAILSPIIRIMAPIAPIAWIPLALILFGIGNDTAIFVVFMGVFFTLTISTVSAIQSVPASRKNMVLRLGATRQQLWRFVIIPTILPHVFLSLRLNFIAAWMAVLAAEMTGLKDGVGAILMIGRNLFNYNLILIGMILIGLLGAVSDLTLSLIQRKILWWGAE